MLIWHSNSSAWVPVSSVEGLRFMADVAGMDSTTVNFGSIYPCAAAAQRRCREWALALAA